MKSNVIAISCCFVDALNLQPGALQPRARYRCGAAGDEGSAIAARH